MSKPKQSKRIPPKERAVEALRLHVEGWSYSQIATQLGVDIGTVRAAIHIALETQTANYADEIKQKREIKNAQLDAVIRGSLPDAEAGVPAAAAVVTAAVKEQIRLYGLAEPEKVDLSGSLTLIHDAEAELFDRLARLVAEAEAGGGPGSSEPG